MSLWVNMKFKTQDTEKNIAYLMLLSFADQGACLYMHSPWIALPCSDPLLCLFLSSVHKLWHSRVQTRSSYLCISKSLSTLGMMSCCVHVPQVTKLFLVTPPSVPIFSAVRLYSSFQEEMESVYFPPWTWTKLFSYFVHIMQWALWHLILDLNQKMFSWFLLTL